MKIKGMKNVLPGRNYTLLYMSEFGSPVIAHVVIKSITRGKYAQYDQAVFIEYIRDGKRKTVIQAVYGSKVMAVYDGHINMEIVGTRQENGFTIREFNAFDNDLILHAISRINATPIFRIGV